jgi:D-lactate dehydrogenase
MHRYCEGFRFGSGSASAVVRPGSLIELWHVAKACTAADAILIVQAANTGLTGGSTPDGDYDRPVVIVSTTRLRGIYLLGEGRQVVCLPGATLHALERKLRPLGREPHSVIGSTCIGASVVGGVCNNSGGALIQRGPAYTELALYAQLDADGNLHLVNELDIDLGADPETILRRLEIGEFDLKDIRDEPERRASDQVYQNHVRDVDADTPARFNADPRCLHGVSGSAGRLVVFAVRLDTFPTEPNTAVFYIGTNDPHEFASMRRDMLSTFEALPVAAEYIHREAFDVAARYGKDAFLSIRHLGTDRLPALFRWKARLDGFAERLGIPPGLSDRLLQASGTFFPNHLPSRIVDFRDRYEHHILLKMAGSGIAEGRAYLAQHFPSESGHYIECSAPEAEAAFIHRFVVAGAAVRYRALHRRTTAGIVALDLALPRNSRDWFETLPAEIESKIVHKLYYGHFFCHVFHQDYLIAPDTDPVAVEHQMWALLDARGAEYPAEHNVGHLYKAKPALARFYRALDPLNQFNPGIGQTSKQRGWKTDRHDCGAHSVGSERSPSTAAD